MIISKVKLSFRQSKEFALCIKITESFELWATSSDPIVAGWHVSPLVHVQVGHHVAGQVDA